MITVIQSVFRIERNIGMANKEYSRSQEAHKLSQNLVSLQRVKNARAGLKRMIDEDLSLIYDDGKFESSLSSHVSRAMLYLRNDVF
jgi:hypothetical protein